MKANKSFWICLGAVAAVMLFLPWALCFFAGPTDFMGIAWLLFFAVDPLCAAAVGLPKSKDGPKGKCGHCEDAQNMVYCFLSGLLGEGDFPCI